MAARFFSAGEMKNLLTPFVTPGGEILDYPRGQFDLNRILLDELTKARPLVFVMPLANGCREKSILLFFLCREIPAKHYSLYHSSAAKKHEYPLRNPPQSSRILRA